MMFRSTYTTRMGPYIGQETIYDESVWKDLQVAIKIGMIQFISEIRMLCSFLASVKPRRILEIGTDQGGSFYLFTRLLPPDGMAISLDLPREGISIESRNKMLWESYSHSYFVLGDSKSPDSIRSVESLLGNDLLDFLFIDGSHLYDDVKKDYEIYREFVRRGGWIGFHDINPHRTADTQVYPFWKELNGFKIEFNAYQDKCGIGVLRKE